MYYFVWLLGAEFLLFCIMILFNSRWGNKLIIYLQQHYPQLYKENLDVPFLAGGPDVMRKHWKALKVAYWGEMPDELSKIYQQKMKLYAKLGILCLFIQFITVIVFVLLH